MNQFKQLKFNVCFTCGKILKYHESMACHFINRRYVATRFDEDNVKVGCIVCNDFKGGNLEVFAKKLGPEIVKRLNQKKLEHVSTPELKDLLEEYKEKLKNL